MNFYLYNDGLDLEKVLVRPVADGDGYGGFVAKLLSEHTDYDFMATVVNDQAGMQCRDRSGHWCAVEPGPLLVNIGKAQQLLAGDRYCGGDIVGGNMRALPHRVVVYGPTERAVRAQLESMQRRISIVGVSEPNGDEAGLVTWDPEKGVLHAVAGLEHCKFWQFLVRKVPEASQDDSTGRVGP